MALTALRPDPLSRTLGGLQEVLQAVFPPKQFHYEIVPARLTAKNWAELTRRTPFVGVSWIGIDSDKNIGRHWTGGSKWSLYLVVSNLTSERARVFGDNLGPGIAVMTTLAVAALNGFTIPGVGSVLARKGTAAHNELDGDDRATALVDIEVGLDLQLSGVINRPADLGELLRMGLTWDFEGAKQLEDLDTIRSTADEAG